MVNRNICTVKKTSVQSARANGMGFHFKIAAKVNIAHPTSIQNWNFIFPLQFFSSHIRLLFPLAKFAKWMESVKLHFFFFHWEVSLWKALHLKLDRMVWVRMEPFEISCQLIFYQSLTEWMMKNKKKKKKNLQKTFLCHSFTRQSLRNIQSILYTLIAIQSISSFYIMHGAQSIAQNLVNLCLLGK